MARAAEVNAGPAWAGARWRAGRCRPPAGRRPSRPIGLLLVVVLICLSTTAAAVPGPREADLCTRAIRSAERLHGLPEGLLLAVAVTETGRLLEGTLMPWPWSINADGDGLWFERREAALEHARELRARGVRSIDVGCMQVNLKWHPEAFADLEAAFDPFANVAYAARHIRQLRARSRDWLQAAGRYHSWETARAQEYLSRLRANWRAVRRRAAVGALAFPPAPGRIDLGFGPTQGGPGVLGAGPPAERAGGALLEDARAPLVDLLPEPGAIGVRP